MVMDMVAIRMPLVAFTADVGSFNDNDRRQKSDPQHTSAVAKLFVVPIASSSLLALAP